MVLPLVEEAELGLVEPGVGCILAHMVDALASELLQFELLGQFLALLRLHYEVGHVAEVASVVLLRSVGRVRKRLRGALDQLALRRLLLATVRLAA